MKPLLHPLAPTRPTRDLNRASLTRKRTRRVYSSSTSKHQPSRHPSSPDRPNPRQRERGRKNSRKRPERKRIARASCLLTSVISAGCLPKMALNHPEALQGKEHTQKSNSLLQKPNRALEWN